MLRFADLLGSDAEVLLGRWIQRLQDGLAPDGRTELELRDHIPALLEELRRALLDGRLPTRSTPAETHGRQRYRIGFSVEQLTREYGALQSVILERAEERGLSLDLRDARLLIEFTSDAVATGISEYQKQQEKRRMDASSAHDLALGASEALFATTLASIGDAVLATDAAGRVTFFNSVAETLTGWSQAAALNRSASEIFVIIAEDTRAPVVSPVEQVLRQDATVGPVAHTLLIRKDGSELPIDDSAAPIRDSAGKLLGAVLVFRDQTEARQREKELSTFRALIDASEDLIAFGSPDGSYHFINPAGRRLIGVDADRQLHAADVYTPETSAETRAAVFPALLRGDYFRGETMFRNFSTGETIPMQQDAFGIRDPSGEISVVATISRDLRTQKATEAAIVALLERVQAAHEEADTERQKLHRLFVQSPVAIAILDGPEHVFTFANPAYRGLMSGRDLVGKRLLEALPDLRGTAFDTMLDSVIATGVPVVVKEMPIKLAHHGDDERLVLDFTYTAKVDAHGVRDGVLMSGWDVTELVDARERMAGLSEQLKASEAQLQLVTNALPVLVAFVDADEHYGYVNNAYGEWFGEPASALLGRSVRDVIGEAAYAVMRPYVARGLAGERFTFEQTAVPYRTGGRDVRVTFVPLQIKGARSGYVALVEDITAQHALAREREQLVKQRVDELERQGQFEQQLIGIVSHDLRTPLNVVTLSSARLASLDELSPNALKNVVRIKNAADRATRMIADLLDFTQARLGGGIRIERRPADLHKLANALMAELDAGFPDRRIECVQEGDCAGGWDPERITQLIQNLVTNALKYGDPTSPVTVTTRGEAADVLLLVHSLGEPISPDKLPVLFEPMQRGVTEIDKISRSVGLGLYIVRQIVLAHGGRVDVDSSAHAGTTFSVRLPRAGA